MTLPFFFAASLPEPGVTFNLDDATAKHIGQVLRMQKGEQLHLTDGKGNKTKAVITEQSKKNCSVQVLDTIFEPWNGPRVTIAISLLKNATRFEWFLEKATEIGIAEIVVLLCQRTERTHFRLDRMKNIMLSAMLQSQQSWLPKITEPTTFQQWINAAVYPNKYIAHCEEAVKQGLTGRPDSDKQSVICIGPEGDFSPEEINLALGLGYQPVTLGVTRLRTETAGIAAAALLRIV